MDGEHAGWMTVQRNEHIELDSIYRKPSMQGRGLGTSLVQGLISEAETTGKPLHLSTAKINPARRLYECLDFVVAGESEFKSSWNGAPKKAKRGWRVEKHEMHVRNGVAIPRAQMSKDL